MEAMKRFLVLLCNISLFRSAEVSSKYGRIVRHVFMIDGETFPCSVQNRRNN